MADREARGKSSTIKAGLRAHPYDADFKEFFREWYGGGKSWRRGVAVEGQHLTQDPIRRGSRGRVVDAFFQLPQRRNKKRKVPGPKISKILFAPKKRG